MLDHVDRQPLLRLGPDRGKIGGDRQGDPSGEQRQPPAGHRSALAGEPASTQHKDRGQHVQRRRPDQASYKLFDGRPRSDPGVTLKSRWFSTRGRSGAPCAIAGAGALYDQPCMQ